MFKFVMPTPGSADLFEFHREDSAPLSPGQARIQVKAIGINHAEIVTRRGDSPSVEFPRVIGIEAVGVVIEDTTGRLSSGQPVICAMGGMGREFDGSYSSELVVPAELPIPIFAEFPSWNFLAAVPLAFGTAYGSLDAVRASSGDGLIVFGGTSTVGTAILSLCEHLNIDALGTSRSTHNPSEKIVPQNSAWDHFESTYGRKAHKAIDLVGVQSTFQALTHVGEHGIVCSSGSLNDDWTKEGFTPIADIPSSTLLTAFDSGTEFHKPEWEARFNELVGKLASGAIQHIKYEVHPFSEIPEIHKNLEAGAASRSCKFVVTV